MEKFEPEIFEIEVNDRVYTVEFCREGLKEADSMGIFQDVSTGILTEKPAIVMYAGLKLHKPDITLNLAKKIWESMLEEGYSIEEFNNTIMEEFMRCFRAFFTQKGKKSIVARKKIKPATFPENQ